MEYDVNEIASLLNDNPDTVLEFEKQPEYSNPPSPPRKKKQHPMPKPVYPGSPEDQENQTRDKQNQDQKAREKKGTNRSPFGDDIERNLANAVAEMLTDDPNVVLEFGTEAEPKQQKQAQKPAAPARRIQQPANNSFGTLLEEVDKMIKG